MSRASTLLLANAFLAAALTATGLAHAAPQPIDGCVDLNADHSIRRFGTQFLVVDNGDDHYRVSFKNSCSDIAINTSYKIVTEGQDNRLCPSGSKVQLKRGVCSIGNAESISEEEYQRYSKR